MLEADKPLAKEKKRTFLKKSDEIEFLKKVITSLRRECLELRRELEICQKKTIEQSQK